MDDPNLPVTPASGATLLASITALQLTAIALVAAIVNAFPCAPHCNGGLSRFTAVAAWTTLPVLVPAGASWLVARARARRNASLSLGEQRWIVRRAIAIDIALALAFACIAAQTPAGLLMLPVICAVALLAYAGMRLGLRAGDTRTQPANDG